MTSVVLPLVDPTSSAVAHRCHELAAFLVRLRCVEGQPSVLVEGAADPAAALAAVARVAVVAAPVQAEGGPGEVRYVPSPGARERVGEDRDGAWPASLASRQRKVVRRAPGAIFSFPLEWGPAGEQEAPVEVFITDWSPSPAACALAVHAAHPVNPGVPLRDGVGFTGRYCRHPLTGDLLPVWVAPWVKPEFGTGAVLVNPGHDKVDLAFGRQVGMPIRFALGPAGYDGSPQSWPTPPVIKTGVAVRTGATDGLPFEEARVAYLRTLLARGLARTCTDYGMGPFRIAELRPDGVPGTETVVGVAWDERRGTVAAGPDATGTARISVSPVLAAADPQVRGATSVELVTPSTSVETDLLAARLLLAEPELSPQVEQVPVAHPVGTVAGQVAGVDPDTLRLTLLTAAAATETLPVKSQQVEAAQRFLEVHGKVAGLVPTGETAMSPEVAKAARQVKDLLQRRDTKQAFTHLYRLQKTVAKGAAVSRGDLGAYEVLSHVLAGAQVPLAGPALAEAWQRI
ncbi:MAG TPA: hypothetical protein VFM55_09625 [Micromonosporaceae bacterium]|nr:hypothetical protein [Micromonosporaceae bacterium]